MRMFKYTEKIYKPKTPNYEHFLKTFIPSLLKSFIFIRTFQNSTEFFFFFFNIIWSVVMIFSQ